MLGLSDLVAVGCGIHMTWRTYMLGGIEIWLGENQIRTADILTGLDWCFADQVP